MQRMLGRVFQMTRALPSAIALIALILAVPPSALAESAPACRPTDSGRLIRYEKVASHPTPASVRAYFDEWIAFYQDFYHFPAHLQVSFDYGFDSYKVTYCTLDAVLPGQPKAQPTVATGMVSVPRKAGPMDTILYLRGTAVSFYDAPSNPNTFGAIEPRGESFEGPPSSAVFAGGGLIVIAPDYSGFGDSTVPRHRYFHAETEASSTVDLLAASRNVLASLRVKQTGELFTFGFSQGGHSALAVHRKLQHMHVPVTGTATVGGVFDVEEWFLSLLTTNTPPQAGALYVSYILLAYDDVYDVFDRTSDVFRKPYASTVSGLFDMQHFWDDVLAGVAATPRSLLKPSYYDTVTSNRRDPMRTRLRQNAVDNWQPRAPLRVYHSTDDEEVPYTSALTSVERLRSRGGDVTVRTVPGDHVNSWIQAMPRALAWFRSLDR
jgi:pimeloyl-ACP methyl ester carboxylesterase